MAAIRLSQLSSMSKSERKQKLESLALASRTVSGIRAKEQSSSVDLKIKKFEGRYDMSSSTMKKRLSSGLIKETADICSWLLLLKQKESLEKKSSKPRPKSVSELLRDS